MLGRILAVLRAGLINDSRSAQDHDTDTLGNVILEKTQTGITRVVGKTKPTAALSGYALGCVFQHVDGANSIDVIYVNRGSATSANFGYITVT